MRAFLAVHPDDEVRERIGGIQQELKQVLARSGLGHVRVTWVRPEAMHITVKFLGDIEDELAEKVQDAVRGPVRDIVRIEIPLTRLGAFPRPREPRVLWIGPGEDWEQTDPGRRLADAVRSIADACERLGAARDEQRWHPHLTLARIRAGESRAGRAIAESGVLDRAVSGGTLRMDTLTLMKSVMRPEGPLHTELWRLP